MTELPAQIRFDDGLIGCDEWKNFELESDPDAAPLLLLNSLDVEDLAFIVADPRLFEPDYTLELSAAEAAALDHPQQEDLIVMVIVTPAPTAGAHPSGTVNLLGPLVINLRAGRARQVLQSEYPSRFPIGESN